MLNWRKRYMWSFLVLAVVSFGIMGFTTVRMSSGPTQPINTAYNQKGFTINGPGPSGPTNLNKILPQFTAAFAAQQMAILVNCKAVSGCWFVNPTNGLWMLSGPKDPVSSAEAAASYAESHSSKTGGIVALNVCGSNNSAWSTHKFTNTGAPNGDWGSPNPSQDEQMLNFYNVNWVWCASYDVSTYHTNGNNAADMNAWVAPEACGHLEPNSYVNDGNADGTYIDFDNTKNGYSLHSFTSSYTGCWQIGGAYYDNTHALGPYSDVHHDYPND